MKSMVNKIQFYSNATRVRLKNRRVAVMQAKDNESLYLEFVRLIAKDEKIPAPSCEFEVTGKIAINTVKISHEAARALYECLRFELGKVKQ